ncbi:MAG TPA: winged helix-turn-helix domain-containing protein [Gammaproteobacteria bacterium]|nr:winged helix-turn-helix domain-containing protein [Gammaproteobacteria bacterium]
MRLSPAEQRLYAADGAVIALERKAFDLLCFLVAQRDRVVGKDELLLQVWGRRIASDTVIAQAVSKARRALVQGGGHAEWVDAARGVGYRYVGPAEVAIPVDGVAKATPTAGFRRRWPLAALVALALALGVYAGMAWQRQQALRDPLRVAVLPWRDDSGESQLAWSSLGLQGLVIDALANDRRIAAVPQGNVRALLGARPDLADPEAQADYLAAATGAHHVYAGRLLREGEGYTVELMLVGEGANASTRIAGTAPAELALAAGSELTQRLLPGFDPARPSPLSRVAYANEAYARGLDARLHGRAAEAAQHLESALDVDPELLPARFQLSLAYQLERDNTAWKRTLDELLELAQARGDRLHQGLALGGLGVHAWREGRFEDAEAAIRASIAYFDGPADATRIASARGNLGSLAAIQGRFDEAEVEMRAALAVFESARMQVEVARVSKNLGVLDIDRGRFDAARAWFERSRGLRQRLGLERDLADTLVSLGAADLGLEAPAAAQASLERAAEIFARYRDPLLESDALARLAQAQIAQGQLSAAAQSAGRSLAAARGADNASARGLAHLRLARIAALRGDRTGALAELERAEEAMRAGNDPKGLARVTLDRLALQKDDARDPAALETLLDEVRRTGWKGLEVELLALRADWDDTPAAARADLGAAYALARAIGEPALVTDLACRYAGLAPDAADADHAAAEARCLEAATRQSAAARFQARRALRNGDIEAARNAWRRARELAGEAWSVADQAELESTAAPDEDAR